MKNAFDDFDLDVQKVTGDSVINFSCEHTFEISCIFWSMAVCPNPTIGPECTHVDDCATERCHNPVSIANPCK